MNPILNEQTGSLSSSNSERSTTQTFMEDKMTILTNILSPSLQRETERPQTLQQAAASPLSPESLVSHPYHHQGPVHSTAVGGRGRFSVSKKVARKIFLKKKYRGSKGHQTAGLKTIHAFSP